MSGGEEGGVPARRLEVGALGLIRPPMERILASAAGLEEAGFDAVWWSDHFLHWYPPSVWTPDLIPVARYIDTPHAFFDPMPIIGAAAQVTERIGLGTAVTDPIRRHPAVLAQTFLTLDHLSQGRALLGIGVGEAENILPFGMPYDRTASRLIEALEVIRLLWSTPDPVDFAGDHFHLDQAILGVEPYGDAPPPIWTAAHRPRTLRATGRLADGWLPVILDPAEYAAKLAVVRSAAAAAGRDPAAIRAGLFAWLVVDEDRDAAERMLDTFAMRFIALTAPPEEFARAGTESPTGSWGLLDYVPTTMDRERALAAANAVPGEVLRRYFVWGTPDDVVERLAGFRAAGLEHVYLVPVTPLADPASVPKTPGHMAAILAGLRRLG